MFIGSVDFVQFQKRYQCLISEIFSFTVNSIILDLPMVKKCVRPLLTENEYEIPIKLLIIPIFNITFTITGEWTIKHLFFKSFISDKQFG